MNDVSLSYPLLGSMPAQTNGGRPPDPDHLSDGRWRGAGEVIRTVGRATKVTALHEVSFELKSGDRLGLLGRNGSGKSTLLRILAGVYPPSSGSVTSHGRIAPMLNISLGVRPEATGRRNIFLRGLLNGFTRAEVESKVGEIIAFSELGPYIDMPVRTYSTGMTMRLAFATATAFAPDILLLDEWIGAGDESFQRKASDRMLGLVEKAGITVIASHQRALIRNVCNLGLWLDGGHVRGFGPIDAVFEAWAEEDRCGNPNIVSKRRVHADT
ncbi:ABC transporter ATP-binding protein [Hyphobacterium sp.]|uniref:ABC transporter ATP-binding protein n=1 Tax=Hyphobacterium sp. TaxID=2004662 RepID=UPI003748268A